MAERLVVIGNGMAAGRALEELFARAPGLYDVTVFGAEPRVNYNRIMLSPVLSGEAAYEDILIHDEAWYAHHGVSLHRGREIAAIDRQNRRVVARDGTVAEYDRLLIATGSLPVIVPLPGNDLPGVHVYRDLDNVEAMVEASRLGGRAVVIGGGLLGLEAAAGLAARGMAVTVVHLMPTLMERQLDPAAGALLRRAVEARGIEVRCCASTTAIIGQDRAEAVRLADGSEIPADLVVMAVGIRPNIALAQTAGLAVKRGVLVDDAMATSDPAVLAVGECVEHRGACYGLVAPLYEMASVAAARLAGDDRALYEGSVTATKLKVTGIELFSAGEFAEGVERDEIVLRDEAHGSYRRLVLRNDRLVGAVLYGDTSDGAWFFDLVRAQTDIAPLRETLIFGETFAELPRASPLCLASAAVPASRNVAPTPKGALRTGQAERKVA